MLSVNEDDMEAISIEEVLKGRVELTGMSSSGGADRNLRVRPELGERESG